MREVVHRSASSLETGSNGGSRGGGGGGGFQEAQQEDEKERLLQFEKETASVSKWRTILVILLATTAVFVCTGSFVFLKQKERDESETAFEQNADAIVNAVATQSQDLMAALSTFAFTITADVLEQQQQQQEEEEWPFVTIQHFEVKAARARLDSSSQIVMFAPIIQQDQRQDWELYSVNHQDWIQYANTEYIQLTSTWFDNDNNHHEQEKDKTDSTTIGNTDDKNESNQQQQNQTHDETEKTQELGVNQEESEEGASGSEAQDDESAQKEKGTEEPTDSPRHGGWARRQRSRRHRMAAQEEVEHDDQEERITPFIHRLQPEENDDNKMIVVSEAELPFYAPLWQISPPPPPLRHDDEDYASINYNLLSQVDLADFIHDFVTGSFQSKPALSPIFFPTGVLLGFLPNEGWEEESDSEQHAMIPPHVAVAVPIHRDLGVHHQTNNMAGVLLGILSWETVFRDFVLPSGQNGESGSIRVKIENTCEQQSSYTYMLKQGANAIFQGSSDRNSQEKDSSFGKRRVMNVSEFVNVARGACEYTLIITPSSSWMDKYDSVRPALYTAALVLIFLMIATVFFIFLRHVAHRQETVLSSALKNDAIVASLFPTNVRERILQDAENHGLVESSVSRSTSFFEIGSKNKLKSFLEHDPNVDEKSGLVFGSRPIADLFPETTIMFADMVGFTAWSSVREPSQVFMLLETVYHAFDKLAHRRRVFKVETVGDCYVAVAGLPEPRADHALIMARFALDCLEKLNWLTKELEVTLGPDTGDLSMRLGLHSGPVTAGVLRGERARFQLFGDTMNTASRMESTGQRGRIQVSPETARLIEKGGKGHWLKPRGEKVFVKGKGEMETFWLQLGGATATVPVSSTVPVQAETRKGKMARRASMASMASMAKTPSIVAPARPVLNPLDEKAYRLIDWNCDLLLRLLRQVVARRQTKNVPLEASTNMMHARKEGSTVLEEVCEIITLPQFDAASFSEMVDPETVELGSEVEAQVYNFVSTIAMLYRGNAFHNFDHASHVAMSVTKLLSRIVAPSDLKIEETEEGTGGDVKTKYASTLHDHTYGITSDPLTQFACVLSALIHDVDHTGVPNVQLVKENSLLASRYRNQSVAEQNSVDLAWAMLMEDQYEILRKTICATETEFIRFRQLVVNSVMATDIVDAELKKLRNQRWDKAFHQHGRSNESGTESAADIVNRKATIVIEHLLQASDVAHTMQHWHIYRKWNERLFEEMYTAYKMGRAEKDPSDGWYQGELGFFDFYIIPLAKKLKDCGVFGVSSFEYLDYAERNRQEWEARGREVVEEMKKKLDAKAATEQSKTEAL